MDDPPPPLPSPGRPLDYASRPSTQGGSVFSVPAFLSGLVMVLLMAAVMFLVVPRIEAILADFNIKLPAVTVAYLSLARWFRRGFGWAQVLPLPVLLGFVAAMTAPPAHSASAPPRRGWHISIAMMIAWLLFAAFVVITVLALLWPMVLLINSLDASS